MRGPLAIAWFSLLGVSLAAAAADGVWAARLPAEERHPCLLFGPEDVPALRARVERLPYRGWWEATRHGADPLSLGFTWQLTGDPAKAESVRRWLLRCNPAGYHCSCGVADALQAVAEAYDLVASYPGLTASEHALIRSRIAQACERYYLGALESADGQHPGNQRTRGLCAMGTAAIVLSGYRDAAHTPAEWLQRALDGISQEANLSFWREDGLFIEGPTYSAFTLAPMLPFARYYARVGGPWLFEDARLRQALLYLISVTQPDGLANAAGTTTMVNVVDGLRLAVGAGPAEDQALFRWAIDQWGSLAAGGARDIALFDDGVRPAAGSFPLNRFLFPSQEASLRSAWSGTAVALWFRGKEPWLARTYPVYSHHDTGSFILHAYGELLAVDAGYDHWVSYSLYPSELHNTLLVDGKGPDGATPGLLGSTVDADELQTGTIAAAYAGVSLERTFLQVGGMYTVIADRVRSGAEHEYRWQVHTPVSRAEGAVRIDGRRASWTGFDPVSGTPGRVALEAVWAGPVRLEPMAASRWQPYSTDPKKGSYENWALTAVQQGAGALYLAALYPHPIGVPSASLEELPCTGGHGLAVASGSVTDTFLIRGGAEARSGGIVSTAPLCALRRDGDRVAWVFVRGEGEVAIGGKPWLRLMGGGDAAAVLAPAHPSGSVPLRLWVSECRGEVRAAFRVEPGAEAAFLCVPGREAVPLPMPVEGGLAAVSLHDTPAGVIIALPAGSTPVRDETPPEIAEVTVDGEPLPEPLERVERPRQAGAPRAVSVKFLDRGAGLEPSSLRATLDGLPVAADPDPAVEGEARLRIPEDLSSADHEIVVQAADRAPVPNRRQFLLRFSLRPLLVNGGFEEGGAAAPAGWSLGAWSDDAATRYEIRAVEDSPRSGRRCLMMRGLAGHLNLVAAQPISFTLGRRYALTGYYRGDAPARASFCSQSGKGQYLWMPALEPSPEWVPFRWEFVPENPEARLLIALRLGAVGTAFFDDLALEECP